MLPSPTQLLRNQIQQLYKHTGGRLWFPHVPLAVLLGIGGFWLLQSELGQRWRHILDQLLHGGVGLHPSELPPILIGLGMLIMALGLLFRSRLAWLMALLLAAAAAVSMYLGHASQAGLLLGYFILVLALLASAWRQFNRTSIAASALFALTSVMLLVVYATFGTFYLGADFKPPVKDLVTAFYYAMVSMSTVGYGDITPRTADARLFAVSVIVLGVAVFATSLTAVIGPLINRSLQRIINRKDRHMQRENHFVVIGNTPLALNTLRELIRRGHPVTLLMRQEPEFDVPDDIDKIFGEPSDIDVLRKAGADKAQTVLAMLPDDSENAFVVLAVRELAGTARTAAVVSDSRHLGRVKLVQPDLVIAPQILGGELVAMLLTGEQITSDFVMQRVFMHTGNTQVASASKSTT